MATIYETDSQLFPQKCVVKTARTLKNKAGRAETYKNGRIISYEKPHE